MEILDPLQHVPIPGYFAAQRPRLFDAFLFVAAPDQSAPREFEFVCLPDGTLISDCKEELLSPFVRALNRQGGYRAEAVLHGEIYALAAQDIQTLKLEIKGMSLLATSIQGRQEARMDGMSSVALEPFLPLAPKGDWSLEASRLDRHWWEYSFARL